MIIFLFVLIFTIGYKVKFAGKGFYSSDYISREQTLCINGVFMAYILLSHTYAKFAEPGILNDSFNVIRTYLGQFPVVPILFFSGYGIMESVKRKKDYIKTFPKHRLLDFYVKFFIFSLPYVVLNLFSREYSLTATILSFTGFESIGNGGWYIGVTIAVYVFVIICFNLFKNKPVSAVASVTFLTVVLMFAEMVLDFPTYYYSTMIFMPLGMCFSLIKDSFDAIVMKNNFIWSVGFVLSVVLSVVFNIIADKSFIFYPVWCFFGLLVIMLFSMKVRINNNILLWIGKTTFYNFILQGIPQKLFIFLPVNDIVYYILVFAATAVLIFGAERAYKPIEMLFKNKA